MTSPTQSKLINTMDNDINNENYFKIYYKSVSIENPESKDDFPKKSKSDIVQFMQSLPSSNELNFNNLKIKTNRKTWITSLLSEAHNNNNINFLITDFAEEMNTNMRGKDKYVILIIMNNELILVHTRMGEKSLSPKFKFFDRMLDKDNILRYVWFKETENKINVRYYEKYQSKFFKEWLGVNRKDLFYEFGGKNKFYLDLYGYPLVLEINDEDFDDNEYFEFDNNSVIFKAPPEGLKINHIQRSNKRYDNINEFEKDRTSRRFNLKYHQDEYNKLINSFKPLENKIYDFETCVKSTNGNYYLEKVNTNLTILFCNEKIDIDDDFLDSLIISILNNGELELCHAGLSLFGDPIIIGKLKIYNKLTSNLANPLINYYNSKEFSSSHKKEFLYAIFHCLYLENKETTYSYFLEKCSKEFSKKLTFSSNIYENHLIELKSRDFISKNNEEIIDNISKDICKKILKSDFKFYILGYDEQTRTYEPLSSQKFPDDRINTLNIKIKEKTKVSKITMFKMEYDDKKCILALIVQK